MTAAETDVQKVGALATFRDMPSTAKLLLVGVFVNQFGAFLQAFLVLYLTHRGFSETHALFGMGAYGFGAVIGLLFGGGMSDRLGPRRTIIVSMVASTVLPISITLMNSYATILVVAVLAGAMAQLYRPAAGSILATLIPPARQVMAFSMNRIALNLGVALGPFLAGALIASDHWDLLFWIDGATALVYVIIALLFLPRVGGEADQDEAGPGARTHYWDVLNDRRYVVFMFAVLTNALIYIQSFSVLPLTLKDRGYSEHVFSWILTISATVLISCELLVTRFTQHWQPRVAASIGLVLLGSRPDRVWPAIRRDRHHLRRRRNRRHRPGHRWAEHLRVSGEGRDRWRYRAVHGRVLRDVRARSGTRPDRRGPDLPRDRRPYLVYLRRHRPDLRAQRLRRHDRTRAVGRRRRDRHRGRSRADRRRGDRGGGVGIARRGGFPVSSTNGTVRSARGRAQQRASVCIGRSRGNDPRTAA